MAAAFCRNVLAIGMAVQAKILFALTSSRLTQQVLVVCGVRTVANQAVALRGCVYQPFLARILLIGVAGAAERRRSGSNQLDPGDVFVVSNLMATVAT